MPRTIAAPPPIVTPGTAISAIAQGHPSRAADRVRRREVRAATSQRPARVLIVDDEPLNVDYLEQELDDHGFVTDTAASGLEALERVAAAPPDIVLLDVMMPGMDGLSTLRILKQDAETKLIPVVLMTALTAVDDRVRGIEAGADDFLSKPVDERELLARIKTAISLKRAIFETVDELASTSAHLERYGRQTREVAVLAAEWRVGSSEIADEAADFLARRQRDAAEETIRGCGGTPVERDASALVAVFEGPDERSRATAAVEAALAVHAEAPDGEPSAIACVAISAGSALVGSARVERAGRPRWAYDADGRPVERAVELARTAPEGGVVIAGAVAGAVGERFQLRSLGNGTYRVLELSGEDAPAAPPVASERRIKTILVTDIVGSTRIAERVGDGAWSELAAAHERATRDELAAFGGEAVGTTDDGVLASFDAPGSAIRCALALGSRLDALGLTVRAGIHTGEIEHVDGELRGIALNVARRVAARANPAEILVTATTRELAAGAGIVFPDRGEHVLRGLSEPRRLYAAVSGQAVAPQQAPAPTVKTELPAGISARELDVLKLVAAGLSDAQVAEQLVLSVRTVNAHLRSIYRKLGVGSRAAAGRFAVDNGLV